jgi:3-methyl-2-oxobutanoate hydroxymethyltransferase
MNKFTITDFNNYKSQAKKITMITAYDFNHAQLIAESLIDTILVGDSLGMVIQGANNTLSVTLDDILYHTKAVRRGAADKFIIADMPYLSYHLDSKTTIQNAGVLICAGSADAVKLEINNVSTLSQITALTNAQIPVIAHIGMTPQSVNVFGGFKVQGKNEAQIQHIEKMAQLAQDAGACALVIECVPSRVAQKISETLLIPTIGIGAGNGCDGQVLVLNDLLGMSQHCPKFAKQYLDGKSLIKNALNEFSHEVTSQAFPSDKYSY